MTAGEEAPDTLVPQAYVWDESNPPPPDVLHLWTQVGEGIDKNQTVVWKSAVESLDNANKYLSSCVEARLFCEKYMASIIGILVEQQPAKIGAHEINCVKDSLALSVMLVAKDLDIQIERKGQCLLLDTLSLAFNRRKAFYKGAKGNWNMNHMVGLPEARLKTIERFRSKSGFQLLSRYIIQKTGTPFFPKLDILHQVLLAACDTMVPARTPPSAPPLTADQVAASVKLHEEGAIDVSRAIIHYITSTSDEALKKIQTDLIAEILRDLQRIFDRLIATRRTNTYEFYAFWRTLVLRLITSKSLPLKLYGWEQVQDLIDASIAHRPPPKAFMVRSAGCTFVNGRYEFAGQITDDGYSRPGNEISYVRRIPDEVEDGGGKKLTLFRCTMRSQQKWWFLSEADEEQPGTDRDIDYYQHKSKEHEESYPPPAGWFTCRTTGMDPPPLLDPIGVLVPEGQEYGTLDHQLAQWAIENEIVEQVLGDTTIHREVVARSVGLIKFLAGMCDRYPPPSAVPPLTKRYCLQSSHLLYAWKTCLRKADAAVSSQVYQLLVSILPLCPVDLAIPLLKAVQTSLHDSQDGRDHLFEVSEFCSALASGNLVEQKGATAAPALKDEVREQVLDLLWSVLTHRDASSLRTYDSLKRYVTHELKVEPQGSEHREKFMGHCIEALGESCRKDSAVDEVQALRMVKLTYFVLEACPREQSDRMVAMNSGRLPLLLFQELTAYLERRRSGNSTGFVRKTIVTTQVVPPDSDSTQHLNAMNERLRILRHVYGLSDPRAGPSEQIVMSVNMIETLWKLCDAPDDREALLVFVASASHSGKALLYDHVAAQQNSTVQQSEQILSAAFAEFATHAIFLRLVCSPSFSYARLGNFAYRSFQYLFEATRQSPVATTEVRNASLDALWRICLTVENDDVASQAMKDLLNVYVTQSPRVPKENGKDSVSESMVTDDKDEKFADRMFQCLSKVKSDLDLGDESAGRSAERCLRILNAAIGQSSFNGSSLTSSTLIRLSQLNMSADLEHVLKCIPHGMRGQACYRRVGVVVKRPPAQNTPQSKEMGAGGTRPSTTLRFPLDLHPLETLESVKYQVAMHCQCPLTSVKPLQVNGRASGIFRASNGDPAHVNFNVVPEDSVVDELGIVEGCEIVFHIAERGMQAGSTLPAKSSRGANSNDLSSLFFNDDGKFCDGLFTLLLGVLRSLPLANDEEMSDVDFNSPSNDTHQLVWDFLLALPTNSNISSRVRSAQSKAEDEPSVASTDDAMDVDSIGESWGRLLDLENFDRSVYVLLTIDAFLRPAHQVLSVLQLGQRQCLEQQMQDEAGTFRRSFIEAGGFGAVVQFFSSSGSGEVSERRKTRRGNAVALRILKACLFGYKDNFQSDTDDQTTDKLGGRLLESLSGTEGLLRSLTSMVIDDRGISSSTMSDVLRFLRLLFKSPEAAQRFVALPDEMGSKFFLTLLLHDDDTESARTSSSLNARQHVRRSARDLILETPSLAETALPWLIQAIPSVNVNSESTGEYFEVMEKLVGDSAGTARSAEPSENELQELGTIVCKKLASCPRPTSESDISDISTGVLCGCLKLLRALIENGGVKALAEGTNALLSDLGVSPWSAMLKSDQKGVLAIMSSTFRSKLRSEDGVLIDLMGGIFDGFLAPTGLSSAAICCDKESRRRGFDVVGAAAKFCQAGEGYLALVHRINSLIESAAPNLRHRWAQFSGSSGEPNGRNRGSSKYTGLRNQGCTCYMNSFLQQLFMMPVLRDSMCSAPLPQSLRTAGSNSSNGASLIGKTISLQWENGVSYDALVVSFDEVTGMHSIRYCPMQVATAGGATHHPIDPDEISRLPPLLPDEFVLSEGRPGKETGVFDIIAPSEEMMDSDERPEESNSQKGKIKETADESASRHLLEEVQRTFIHLLEGSRGRCFDPRALVEACTCLKLEFDVWQQNDASEFATKFLDRLEIVLKKWAPEHFKYMDHTFGMKQTKQKICRECGLKTNREEKLLNIDCQIRGKTDIHEALAAMTEVEIMEGSNKVFCDNCKKNTDTILRTAISTLPNMLILSLKRFDLDYNTFETVKLNSRCAFDQTLNMKRYTLEGLEAVEKAHQLQKAGGLGDPSPMETDDGAEESVNPLNSLPDADYGYRLAGVLVHAGVAQGGHYYSFIKDRNPGSEEKWYRFDDEDVTPFDPASLEAECFGGKIKKESKWPNGQVHTVEQEQFANALMLFYEKIKPTDPPSDYEEKEQNEVSSYGGPISSGYDVFNADVRRSNATHMWQSFLFDCELQTFLKELLGMCRMPEQQNASNPWRVSVLQMLLAYVFDVMMYASDRTFLHGWTIMLEEALVFDCQSSRDFVHQVARKTREVSGNWIRNMLLDCPDQGIRASSVRIFIAGIRSCSTSSEERIALDAWCRSWEEQSKAIALDKPAPVMLEGQFAALEDVDKLGAASSSSLGVIISHLNALLDAMPRCWRFSSELCLFIRQLASVSLENGDFVFRHSLVASLVPLRLIALAVRDRILPPHVRLMLPGITVSVEAANTQARPEANPSAHMMSMSQSHMMHGSDTNAPRGPGPQDFGTILEALICIAGIPCGSHATLVHDTGEISRGRRRYTLSEAAIAALSQVFQECCIAGAPGMGQREIETYLNRCGVDTTQVTSQKILDTLNKYHTTACAGGSAGQIYLNLDGFLAYYRDTVQSNDMRLRQDLNTFGFRPDLSRRSKFSRIHRAADRTVIRDPAESIAIDVAEYFGDKPCSFGLIADLCLNHTFPLYTLAFTVAEHLAYYLVAGAGYKKDCTELINRTLQAVYTTPNEWGGNDTITGAIMVLKVLASLPGTDQEERISLIMESKVKVARNAEHGAGLLLVIRFLYHARQSQHYHNNEVHWTFGRYIDILKALRKTLPVRHWMSENGGSWSFLDHELLESHAVIPQQSHQIRGDYVARDGGVTVALDHHTHSDSDIAGINESDDDDSHFEINDSLDHASSAPNDGPFQIIIEGAGLSAVNGTYHQDGHFQGACRYMMEGRWDNQVNKFYIFQCNVSNNTKHWYISIVPSGSNPGTSSDIDFYTAPATAECRNIPPSKGWVKAAVGKDPPPSLEYREKNEEEAADPEGMWKGFEEMENHGTHGPGPYV